MRRLIALAFLIALLISPVSAGHATAITAASTINTYLASRVPYTIELTPAQMVVLGYDAYNNTRPGCTYKVTFKNATYNPSDGTLELQMNVWCNATSIRINNPVRLYMSDGITGSTETTRLRNFGFRIISYVDNKPFGDPINDDTLLVYPDIDGYAAESTDANYATIRGDAGDTSASGSTTSVGAPSLTATTTADVWSQLRRGILSFNTSSIPNDATINSGLLSLYVISKSNAVGSPDYGITGGTLASNTSIANGDYDGFTGTRYASDIAYASISTTNRNNWSLNAAGLSAVSKNSYTILFLRDSWDIDNSFTGTWASAAYSSISWRGVAYATESARPFMEIIYTPYTGDTTPPASITGLTNTTPNCGNVSFNWTNPSDSDYNGLMLWRNNTALTNLTNSSTSVFWDGLPENTDITFSSKTFDFVGNVNATFVNKTAHTPACPTPPTPTPTPTTTPLAGCTFVNMTGITIVNNSSSWEIAEGNKSWGVLIVNWSQGNVSHYGCIGTPITTATPNWVPVINPSVSRRSFWCGVPIIKDLLNWC